MNTSNTFAQYDHASGPGIELSKALRKADIKNQVLTFLGGFNGFFIKDQCRKMGLKTNHVRVSQETPLFIEEGGRGMLLTLGAISTDHANEFQALIKRTLKKAKIVVVLGPSVSGLSPTYFSDILHECKAFPEVKIVVSGPAHQWDELTQTGCRIDLLVVEKKEWGFLSEEMRSGLSLKSLGVEQMKVVENGEQIHEIVEWLKTEKNLEHNLISKKGPS